MSTKDQTYLIQYQGGGYDGCIWEWNYCLIHNQEFRDIASSGALKIKSYKEFKARKGENDMYIYNVHNKKQMQEFMDSSNVAHVKGVLCWLSDELGIEYLPECPVCHQKTYPDEMIMGDYSGDGGIGIEYHNWHCAECDSSYRCDMCYEFDITTTSRAQIDIDRIKAHNYRVDGKYICNYCFDEAMEDIQTKEDEQNRNDAIADINHNAFINGLTILIQRQPIVSTVVSGLHLRQRL